MNISRRERILLTLLFVVVFLYLSFTYLIEPQFVEVETLNREIKDTEEQILKMKVAQANIKKLEEELKEKEVEIKERFSEYLGAVEQEDIILLIHEILLRSDVEVSELSFTPFHGTEMMLPSETDDKEERELPFGVDILSVRIPYSGTYEDVMALFSSFWRFDQNIYVNALQMTRGDEVEGARTSGVGSDQNTEIVLDEIEVTNEVSGEAELVFMRINDEYASNEPIFEWFLDEIYDVGNPFLVREKDVFYNNNYYYIGKDVEFYNKEYDSFADITGHWAESVIDVFGLNGYIEGDDLNNFYPDGTMSRMDFIILLDKLYRWDIVDDPKELSTYDDYALVSSLDPMEYKILQKGVNSGYVYGFEDNTLRPYDAISYLELEFFSERISSDDSLKWTDIAASMESELGHVSTGLNDLRIPASKAEIIYLLYYLNK